MLKERELIHILDKNSDELQQAIDKHSGKDMCERSRMIIGILSILSAYYPELCSKKLLDQKKQAFDDAISCIENNDVRDHHPDSDNNLYLKNIKHRKKTLIELGERLKAERRYELDDGNNLLYLKNIKNREKTLIELSEILKAEEGPLRQ